MSANLPRFLAPRSRFCATMNLSRRGTRNCGEGSAMPRPSSLLVVTSTIFIGGCLFIGGIALAGFGHWDPCAWFVSVVFIGPSFGLAYAQYAATFLGSAKLTNNLRYLLP